MAEYSKKDSNSLKYLMKLAIKCDSIEGVQLALEGIRKEMTRTVGVIHHSVASLVRPSSLIYPSLSLFILDKLIFKVISL